MYLFQGEKVDEGNVRETFLVNQLSYNQTVEFSAVSDFFVNNKYTIECGGKSKTGEQIKIRLEYALNGTLVDGNFQINFNDILKITMNFYKC